MAERAVERAGGTGTMQQNHLFWHQTSRRVIWLWKGTRVFASHRCACFPTGGVFDFFDSKEELNRIFPLTQFRWIKFEQCVEGAIVRISCRKNVCYPFIFVPKRCRHSLLQTLHHFAEHCRPPPGQEMPSPRHGSPGLRLQVK